LDIIELTPELVVINKPVGRHSHPLLPGEQGTVANALVARFSECITASVASREGGLIHRLDLYTSGVLLAARHRTAYLHFRELFTGGHVQKHYLALVVGVINESGSILTGIRPMPNDPARVKVVELDEIDHDSPTAHTEFYPIEQLGTFTLVRLIATTGRRHQIRVHMAHIGHPLVGDETYGGPTVAGVQGAFLHAEQIKIHSEGYSFSAPLPSQRQEFLERLRGKKKE
jgi:23S rRNA pseudouridine1911/1915/1917 synthase